MSKQWRMCCAPGCDSKSSVMPNKCFFQLPTEQNTRSTWLRLLDVTVLPATKMVFVCEDHFNKEDIENYAKAKILGVKSSKMILRKGALPIQQGEEKENINYEKESKSTQTCETVVLSKSTQCDFIIPTENIFNSESSDSSPLQKKRKLMDYEASSTSTNSDEDSSNRVQCYLATTYIIEKDPKYYLGLSTECFHLVKILVNRLEVRVRDIYIVLKKIALDVEYKSLADDFGLSISQISYSFKSTLYKLKSGLHRFVFWPPATVIQKNLPISFRLRYRSVVSIIDCFEIIIEKPQNPIHQSLTWSEYKKNNTIKYLISCTPDGFINFISKGFGGRASDITIVLNSGYLDVLPKNRVVMADRGFKGLDVHLQEKGCCLVRPPSVVGEKLSKDDVMESKRIASLRIHVERVINRIRNFKTLSLHSCLDRNLVQHLDEMVYLSCCIINTQGYIIKNML